MSKFAIIEVIDGNTELRCTCDTFARACQIADKMRYIGMVVYIEKWD